MIPKTNEKVLAVYDAVWALIDEGKDIYKMKVADITARAGIGKGTAYEYFRSKEEIVGNAIQYELYQQYLMLSKRLEEQQTFKDALHHCFVWLEENKDRRQFTMQLLRKMGIPGDPEEIVSVSKEVQCGTQLSQKVLEKLVELGYRDGTIPRNISVKLASLQILSQLLGFFVFQEMGNPRGEDEISIIKEYLYHNLEKCFCQEG